MRSTIGKGIAGIASATVLAIAASMTTASTAVAQDEHAETRAAINAFLQQGGPGVAVYAGDGEESWTLSAGTVGLSATRSITEQDHFRIGSQTKTVVSAVLMQLFDEGKLDLDAPIETYLPGVVHGNYDGHVITTRQLLNHTSGLVRDTDAQARPDGSYDLAELVESVMDEPPVAAPGERAVYSNAGYLLLGLLIERLDGVEVGEAITERIIKPLGLEGTSFPAKGERALADPYVNGYQGWRVFGVFFGTETTTASELSYWSSAGAMASTLEDLGVFYRALSNAELFSERALAEMRTTVPKQDTLGLGIEGGGLGIDRMSLPCAGVAWAKSGSLPTGHTSWTFVTEDGRFASVVTNVATAAGPPNVAATDVARSALCED